jgi:DNA-binding FadR family transcriptional regulator
MSPTRPPAGDANGAADAVLRRIEPSLLTKGVLTELASYIERTGLEQGDRLPPEREIAQRLGVSRPLVREALGRWSALGLVETINGRGTYLRAPIAPDQQPVVFVINPERETLLHTLEIRRALEPEAAALAASRATPDQIDALDALLVKVEEAYRVAGDAPDEDWAFHQAVYRASGNPMFIQLIDGVRGLFHRFWENPLGRPDFARRGLTHHRTLVERIRARDPVGAREATLRILGVLEEELRAEA